MRKILLLTLSALVLASLAFSADEPDTRKFPATVQNPYSLSGVNEGWLPMPNFPSTAYLLGGAEYFSNGVVWIAGYRSSAPRTPQAWRSTDHGSSWSLISLPGANRFSFGARGDSVAIVGTFDGKLFRTTNRGQSWDSVYYYGAGSGWFDGVKFMTPDTVFAFGDADASGLLVIRSTDAGATWTRLTNLPATEATPSTWSAFATYNQAIEIYGRTIWMALYQDVGIDPRILKSTDAGDTWDSWAVPMTGGNTTNYYIRSINFLDDSVGYAVDRTIDGTNWAYLMKTTNGGRTWGASRLADPAASPQTQELRSVKPIRGTNVVVAVGANATAGNTARILWSTDGGTTFTDVPASGLQLYNCAFISATQGFAVGDRTALKYTVKNVRKVTFVCNTATVPDTLPVTGQTVQIRGGVNHAGGFSPITWGNDAQNNLTAAGGDYWKKTLYLQVGDTLSYKYVIAYTSGTGWEQGVVPGDFPLQTNANRSFIVPDKDTTAEVEFWNNGANNRPQYFRPWANTDPNFFTVYVRVNMMGPISSGTFAYNNTTDTVGVRGGGPPTGDLNWAPTFYLTKESAASNGDGYTAPPASFWSAGLRIPKDSVTEGSDIAYKFLIGYNWGRDELQGQPNRSFKVPVGKKDTTLKYVYFNNERPSQRANPDTIAIRFRVNLAQAAASGGVDVVNDTIQVRTGYFTTAQEPARAKRLQRVAGTIFTVTDTIITAKGKDLDYQYYLIRAGQDVRESYYNFYYSGPTPSEAERRQIAIPASASLTTVTDVFDTATSITQARRQPVFTNKRTLARNVNVHYEVDIRPAYYQLKYGLDTLYDVQSAFRNIGPSDADSLQTWGVWINGTALGAWGNPTGTDWGIGLRDNLAKKMWDDASNGDRIANDSIWSRIVLVSPDSIGIGDKGVVGQTFKFGIFGGDNEGGRGGFGNNHTENVVDSDTAYTIASQFGSINPAYYDHWDYDLHQPKFPVGVANESQPLVFALAQNYPNPFNPSTRITFSIPTQSKVTLKVYNLLGQEVATLLNEVKPAGVHNLRFDARNLASGMYLYRIVAGDFTSVKKMLLMK